jgi:hypothetical protein
MSHWLRSCFVYKAASILSSLLFFTKAAFGSVTVVRVLGREDSVREFRTDGVLKRPGTRSVVQNISCARYVALGGCGGQVTG